MGSCLGALQLGVDGVFVSLHDAVDDTVVAVRLLIGLIERLLGIGFVCSEQYIDTAFTIEEALPKEALSSGNGPHVRAGGGDLELRFVFLPTPRPGVAKPKGGQHMDLGSL